MHYSGHRLTAEVTTCQPMTKWFALLANWSVRHKQNRVSSLHFSLVQLHRCSGFYPYAWWSQLAPSKK